MTKLHTKKKKTAYDDSVPGRLEYREQSESGQAFVQREKRFALLGELLKGTGKRTWEVWQTIMLAEEMSLVAQISGLPHGDDSERKYLAARLMQQRRISNLAAIALERYKNFKNQQAVEPGGE